MSMLVRSFLVLSVALSCPNAFAQDSPPTVETVPPVVVETVPRAGVTDVQPGETEIRVTFSKPMMDQSWSWSTAWTDSAPAMNGKPKYTDDGRTCVVAVKLEPGRTYGYWINSQRFGNFKDRDGRSAVPYLLVFATGDARDGDGNAKGEKRSEKSAKEKDHESDVDRVEEARERPSAGTSPTDATPPVFDRRGYEEAKAAAVAAKKWFVVKATATWCGPCKEMDRTTWRDDDVVQWLEDHAIVVAVDVDEQPELSERLRIEAMPTMIAFKEGDEEFDRIVGYRDPADFLDWVHAIEGGKKSLDVVREHAGDRDDGDVDARMDLARQLAQSGRGEEAADEYVWLWQHILEQAPAMYGVRLSFMASEMEQLAARDAGAKQKFVALRDATTTRIEGDPVTVDDVVDWVTLNEIVGDTGRTLEWFDRVKDDPASAAWRARVFRDLLPLLVADERWVDIGRTIDRPLDWLELEKQVLAMTKGQLRKMGGGDEALGATLASLRRRVAPVYAGLLAAGREETTDYAASARELDDSADMVMALVGNALAAGQPRDEHLQWLDAAKHHGDRAGALDELRAEVVAALQSHAK